MLDKKVASIINDQITKEFYSAYLYLDFANYYQDLGLDGFAHWYEIQAQSVTFEAIDKPDMTYTSAEDPLRFGLEHEQYITGRINAIYKAANDADDYRTMQCFDWFIKEQGEEEKNADDLIKKYKLFGGDAKGLYQLNQELLARVYTAPSLVL